jgi:signal transduction histidine kinase
MGMVSHDKCIREANGSEIWVKNNKDGKVTTFSFDLPLSG